MRHQIIEVIVGIILGVIVAVLVTVVVLAITTPPRGSVAVGHWPTSWVDAHPASPDLNNYPPVPCVRVRSPDCVWNDGSPRDSLRPYPRTAH